MNDARQRRGRGEGSVFKMPGSAYWWLGYGVNGKRIRESAHTTSRSEALKMLRERLHTITAGTYSGRDAERLTFEAIAEGLRNQYKLDGLSSLARVEQALTRLSAHFEGWRVRAITTGAVKAYHTERLAAGAAQATVQYEIACLKHAFNLARENCPGVRLEYKFGRLANARQGFFERADFEALRAVALPWPGTVRRPSAMRSLPRSPRSRSSSADR